LRWLSFRVNFSYRIGKLSVAGPPRCKQSVANPPAPVFPCSAA
jgi:hypothetical protein